MGHQHGYNHYVNLAPVFFLNLVFTFIEVAGGLFTNSTAVFSDALHDFGDTLSIGLAWYFQVLGRREANTSFTFGYKRFNTLGAFVTGIVLLVGSVVILFESVPRLFNPQEVHAPGMIVLAILGVLANGIAYWYLHRQKGGLNERVLSLHLLEDVLGWVAILIGSILVYAFGWLWIDPLLSIAIMLFILIQVSKNLWSAIRIIMQAKPGNISIREIESEINGMSILQGIHHTHVWSLDGEYNILTTHIQMDANSTLEQVTEVKRAVRNRLKELGIDHATIEVETTERKTGCED